MTARARQRHVQHGIAARCRDAEQESVNLRVAAANADQEAGRRITQLEVTIAEKDRALERVERERGDFEDSLAMARADRDSWRERAADAARNGISCAARLTCRGGSWSGCASPIAAASKP